MKNKICIGVLMLFFLCSCRQQEKSIVVVSNTITEIPLNNALYEDLEGNPVLLSAYKGKKILLNFWATWCRPCVDEMPDLLRLQTILEKEGYVFLFASDESTEKVTAFSDAHSFDFNYIRFTGSLSQLHIYALPTTFIYNDSGKKVDVITGAGAWDSEQLLHKLKHVK